MISLYLSPQGFRCVLKTRATSFLNDIKQHIIVEVVEILKTQDVNWNVQSSKGTARSGSLGDNMEAAFLRLVPSNTGSEEEEC